MLAIGNDDRAVGGGIDRIIRKKLLLAISNVPGQCAARCGRQSGDIGSLHALVTSAHAESKSFESVKRGGLERLEKEPAFRRLIVLEIKIAGIAGVPDAVENTGGVIGDALKQVAMQCKANVAIWNKAGWQRTFVEVQIGIGLQLLEADGRLEFSGLELKRRIIAIVQPRIENLGAGAAKIGNELKIKIAQQGALKNRPGPTQEKAVVSDGAAIAEERARIDLEHAFELDDVFLIG